MSILLGLLSVTAITNLRQSPYKEEMFDSSGIAKIRPHSAGSVALGPVTRQYITAESLGGQTCSPHRGHEGVGGAESKAPFKV